jgi:hypothetical protein
VCDEIAEEVAEGHNDLIAEQAHNLFAQEVAKGYIT